MTGKIGTEYCMYSQLAEILVLRSESDKASGGNAASGVAVYMQLVGISTDVYLLFFPIVL